MTVGSPVFVPPEGQISLDFGGTLKFKGSPAGICRINPELLDDEIQQHPATFAWLAVLTAKAAQISTEQDDQLKLAMADGYLALREESEAKGWKSTEDRLKHMVNQLPSVIAQRERAAKAQHDLDCARGLLESYKCRKDLLVCLANDRRTERNLT